MQTGKYECLIVGGGVAGLMAAVRLARWGVRVAVIEHELLGAGATTHNHGMIHSGALYARWHPEIVADCMRGQGVFRASFPDCFSDTETCWYIGTPATLGIYTPLWQRRGLHAEPVDPGALGEVLTCADPGEVTGYAVREFVIDSHALIAELAARALAAGVELIVGADAHQVVTENAVVRGVQTSTVMIEADNVVVCAGIGTHALLERSNSIVAGELTSRLETMMAFPGALPAAIIGLEFGWPFLAPSTSGRAVLASRYGAPQRFVRDEAHWPVPATETSTMTSDLATRLRSGLLDLGAGVAWVGAKTEHTHGGGADQWGTAPNYAVIDHQARDGVRGWWTVLPGKMTLALHASRSVAAAITGAAIDLALPPPDTQSSHHIEDQVAATPWAAHEEVSAA